MTDKELLDLVDKEKALITEAIAKVERDELKTLEEAEDWLAKQGFSKKFCNDLHILVAHRAEQSTGGQE